MNRLAIRELVIATTGRADKASVINSAINFAVEEVSRRRLWLDLLTEDSVTLLVDEASVELASDAKRIKGPIRVLDGLNSYNLQIKTKTWIDTYYPARESMESSKPCHGFLMGSVLNVVPPTDEEFEISYSYYRLHPELTSDTDELLINEAKGAVVSYVHYWLYKSLEMHVEAQQWYLDFEQQLNSAKSVASANSVIVIEAEPRLSPYQEYPPGYATNPFWKDM